MTKTYSLEIPSQNTPLGGGSADDMPIDFKALIGTVYRRFWIIVTGFLVTLFAVAYITFTQTPIYKANSILQLDTNKENVIDLGSVLGGLAASTATIDTEVRVMGSKSLLTKVATKLKLSEDPEFNWTLREHKPGLIEMAKGQIGAWTGHPPKKTVPYANLSAAEREAAILESVTRTLINKVHISRIGTTYLIQVDVTSQSPETAARIADAVADQYRVQQLDSKLEATRRATAWLSERVAGLRDEVEAKEKRVEEFRAETGLLSAQGATLTEQQIAYNTTQKSQLQAQLNRARSRYDNMKRQIDSGVGIDAIAEVLDSPVISGLKAQRAQILRRVAELETTLGPSHPELIGARNEAADIERQIESEVSRIAANLENEVKAAQDQINSINSNIGQSTAQLRGNNINLVRLRELERDAETSRVLYEEFISRSKETREQDDLVQADANILSTATVPDQPSSPRKLLNLIIGALLGGIIGGGLALLAEIFDMKISSADDIERKLGVNSIGSVPLIRSTSLLPFSQINPADFLVDNPLSAFAESIRYLRAAIAFSDLDSETKTVAITSSLPDEGKTSLTLSLGRMSAMSGSRTLVIDGDFRRRQLTDAAGMSPEIGFIEHLFGAGQLSDAICKDSRSMLDILPLSKAGHVPHDVFGTRAFDDLLARLRSMYDLILIDTGPLLLMSEARVVAGKTDKTILVIRWRRSLRSAVRQSLTLLKTFNADLLGITLNMVDLSQRRHHKDPGAAYKAYSKYYSMETKRSIFGWSKTPKASGMTAAPNPMSAQVKPGKSAVKSGTSSEVSTH
ncbi:MAG: Wzz/FepE/Etk N-terminal domain-containing protein [Hyphomonas sp.]|uniref:GumC family protein n=1 Tax=Hyphomonas sp. TaxID=87 RepID=UPI003002B2EA